MQVLSAYFACEIATIDAQSGNVYVYGRSSSATKRIYLLYNGIHYDVVKDEVSGSMTFAHGDETAAWVCAKVVFIVIVSHHALHPKCISI